MRVVAGQFRGRKLIAPPGSNTRPILDRVKVSLFDWLGSRLAMPGVLPSVPILDVFCGSGSLGIEALSRGASWCTFVERDRVALDLLRQNLEGLGLRNDRFHVIGGAAESAPIHAPPAGPFEIVFLDPPYPLSEMKGVESVMSRLMFRLGSQSFVAAGALIVWRHEERCRPAESWPGGWKSIERREWSTMAITLFSQSTEAIP